MGLQAITLNSLANKRFTQMKLPSCLCAYEVLAVHFKKYILSGIAVLFGRGGPTAIRLAIGTVVIYAVKRMGRAWARPHILVECLKAIKPFSANSNATAPISLIRWVVWIRTALFHGIPTTIFGSVMPTMLQASQTAFTKLSHQTTATSGKIAYQISSIYNSFLSAITAASPQCDGSPRNSGDSHKLPKSLTRQINKLSHITIITQQKGFGYMCLGFQAVDARIAKLEKKLEESRA